VWAAATSAWRRLRTGLAHDARVVGGTTTAARRRLRPEPRRLDPGDTLTAPAVPGAAGDVTTEFLAVPAAGSACTADGDDPDATVAFPVVAGRAPGGSSSDTTAELVRPSGGVAVLTAPEPTGAEPGPVPTRSPAAAAPGREAPSHDRSPSPAHDTQAHTASVGPGDVRRRAPRRRSEGQIVPLHVPWRTRLRATAGLLTLVAFLGTLAAATVAAVLLALLQVLSSV
jgi:hypothetical protein